MARRSPVGGLYAFRIGPGEACGLCTHEVNADNDGDGPRFGPLVRFFRGIDARAPDDTDAILSRPVLTSLFVPLGSMLWHKQARKLAKVTVPPALAQPPVFRVGGSADPAHYFLVRGVGDEQVLLEGPVSRDEIAAAPEEALGGIGVVERYYQFDLAPERAYAFETGETVLDEERDALF